MMNQEITSINMKFQAIDNKELISEILPCLQSIGYKEVINPTTGQSNDYVIIDVAAKRYAWFEFGFEPNKHELHLYNDKNLKDLFGMYYS